MFYNSKCKSGDALFSVLRAVNGKILLAESPLYKQYGSSVFQLKQRICLFRQTINYCESAAKKLRVVLPYRTNLK